MANLYSDSLRAFLKPILPFLDDPDVSEIMVNGPEDIWIEKRGKLTKTAAVFTEEGVIAAARNMAQFVGRPLSDDTIAVPLATGPARARAFARLHTGVCLSDRNAAGRRRSVPGVRDG